MNLNDIDFENIGGWPLGLRLSAAFITIAAILGAGFYFFTQDSIAKLEQVEAKEVPLKKEFKNKQGKAANLEAYRAQMVEMETRFGSMLRQLPQKAEVADLLVEISQTGLSNNLEFSLFKPSGEARKEFYAELPVSIKVTGTYHDFGGFATGIAALPRIVTIHNINMSPVNKNTKGDSEQDVDKKLTISLIAKTYRYLDDEENRPKKKKRRKR
ncbi:MAG: type 4a pilus biogenesis protein PilO [gamma proteobacterium symbiont of Taylorina sp.]|nr:type 4a pilus biogenesis protein PilO [gamma proteobacterium symbiont of Taylorina sp.]